MSIRSSQNTNYPLVVLTVFFLPVFVLRSIIIRYFGAKIGIQILDILLNPDVHGGHYTGLSSLADIIRKQKQKKHISVKKKTYGRKYLGPNAYEVESNNSNSETSTNNSVVSISPRSFCDLQEEPIVTTAEGSISSYPLSNTQKEEALQWLHTTLQKFQTLNNLQKEDSSVTTSSNIVTNEQTHQKLATAKSTCENLSPEKIFLKSPLTSITSQLSTTKEKRVEGKKGHAKNTGVTFAHSNTATRDKTNFPYSTSSDDDWDDSLDFHSFASSTATKEM
jgi:hypothetical protein